MNRENTEAKDTWNQEISKEKASRFSRAFKGALIIFVLTVGVTGFLWYRISVLDNAIRLEEGRIRDYENSIVSLRSDPRVQAVDILQKTKSEVVKIMDRADITRYINELQALRVKYSLNFTGFSFMNNTISTTVHAIRSPISDPVSKTVKFIGDFRDDVLTGSLALDPVSGFAWGGESRTFNVVFTIK